MIKLPDFRFENKARKLGFSIIGGADEVGRGCFAGPVVAGVVALSGTKNLGQVRIDDSKKLTAGQREEAEKWIKENALTWGIGISSVSLINRIGMAKATRAAFRKAINAANYKIKLDFILVDAFFIPYTRGLAKKHQMPIINGDEKSLSIAAASIVAKVYRDNLMVSLSQKAKYKKYGWARNKGYGTAEHREAILVYGITEHHRKKFVETFLGKI